MLPVWILELARHQRVEVRREHAQIGMAARIFLIEPLHQDHVGDAGDVPAEIAALRLRAQDGIAIEDRPGVLGGDRGDRLVGTVEQNIGAHHATSVTDSLPLAASWMTATFWPGVQVKYSGRTAGR